MRVFISAPAGDGYEQSVACARRAGEAAAEVVLAGHTPYIPHFQVLIDQLCFERYGAKISIQTWQRIDREEIDRSDALLFLGADARTITELAYAHASGKTILCGLSDLL